VADPVDRLYAAPLDEFVAARRDVVKELKAAGEDERAAEVAAYRKPSLMVWSLNQAARWNRKTAKAFVQAAQKLAAVQARRSKGDIRREQERVRELGGELVDAAEQALRNADRLRADSATRLHELVRAVAGDEEARTALAAGRLSQEPEATGFEALGVLGDVEPPRTAKDDARERKAQEARDRREAELREQRERLEDELAEAERDAAQARRAVEAAERRVESARRSLDRLGT
jgi:hypothetical protein